MKTAKWVAAMALVGLFIVAGQADAGTMPLGDCQAACGYADPDGLVALAAQYPECTQLGTGRCTYTIDPVTADTWGGWVKASEDTNRLDNCNHDDCVETTYGYSCTTQETATSSYGVDVGATVKAEVNIAFIGKTGIEAQAGFTAGTSDTSSINKTYSSEVTLDVARCGKKDFYWQQWRQSRPCHTTVEIAMEWQLYEGGEPCSPWTEIGFVNGDCTCEATFTSASKKVANKAVVCPRTCSSYHQNCDKSCTTSSTNPCPPTEY